MSQKGSAPLSAGCILVLCEVDPWGFRGNIISNKILIRLWGSNSTVRRDCSHVTLYYERLNDKITSNELIKEARSEFQVRTKSSQSSRGPSKTNYNFRYD